VAIALFLVGLAAIALIVATLLNDQVLSPPSDEEIAEACTDQVTKRLGADHRRFEDELAHCRINLEGLRETDPFPPH